MRYRKQYNIKIIIRQSYNGTACFFVNFTKEIYNPCNLYGSVIAGTGRHIYNKYRNEVRPPQGAGESASYV